MVLSKAYSSEELQFHEILLLLCICWIELHCVVAMRLLAQKTAVYKDSTMKISLPSVTSNSKLSYDGEQQPDCEEISNVVEVGNIPGSTDTEWLRLFFESVRCSGGGDIKDLIFMKDEGKAVITYTKVEG